MKTLNKIKLNNLSAENLSEKQMKEIKGGAGEGYCGCSCLYEGNGGASSNDNCTANARGHYYSLGGASDHLCMF